MTWARWVPSIAPIRCWAVFALAGVACSLSLDTLCAQTLLPRPAEPLRKVEPQSPALEYKAVQDRSQRLQSRSRPAAGQGQAITVTCPPNASPYAVSTDAQSSGWTIGTTWSPFLDVSVANPASLNAGAVVNCVYGHKRGTISDSMPMFKLSKNVGAGINAATCSINGDTATCAGGKTLRCPPPRSHIGADHVQGWTIQTGWPSGFMHATVTDPASTNAGAVVSCFYGPIDIRMTPTVVFTLRRNFGPGIEAGMCAVDVATRTATCKR